MLIVFADTYCIRMPGLTEILNVLVVVLLSAFKGRKTTHFVAFLWCAYFCYVRRVGDALSRPRFAQKWVIMAAYRRHCELVTSLSFLVILRWCEARSWKEKLVSLGSSWKVSLCALGSNEVFVFRSSNFCCAKLSAHLISEVYPTLNATINFPCPYVY